MEVYNSCQVLLCCLNLVSKNSASVNIKNLFDYLDICQSLSGIKDDDLQDFLNMRKDSERLSIILNYMQRRGFIEYKPEKSLISIKDSGRQHTFSCFHHSLEEAIKINAESLLSK